MIAYKIGRARKIPGENNNMIKHKIVTKIGRYYQSKQ